MCVCLDLFEIACLPYNRKVYVAKFLSFKLLRHFIFAKTARAYSIQNVCVKFSRFFYLCKNIVTANISGYTVSKSLLLLLKDKNLEDHAEWPLTLSLF